MIQINLIPDVKQEFLRAQSNKRIVVTLSMLVSGAFVAIVILLWSYVTVVQNTHTNNLDEHIDELLAQYQSPENVSKVLTVNGQLYALGGERDEFGNILVAGLHDEKPAMTRLSNYLTKLVPNEVSIDSIEVDLEGGTMLIKGLGKNTVAVDKFINTLRNAVYYIDPGDSGESVEVKIVFTGTTLERYGTSEKDEATFEIRTAFDTQIFNNSLDIVLTVPRTSSDEAEFTDPKELIKLEQNQGEREDDLFEPIDPEEVE